ncbi:MAG TPA: hypothetical protein VEQ63_13365, partial [Bryobacteraceae bacterium]|nr:hypothetical protein [Bryobacteraceae bacterium]
PFHNGRTANRLALPGDRYLYRPDRNNFQPRLGAAWEFREGSVLRASYGSYADRLVQIMFTNVVNNGPLALSSNSPNQRFVLASPFPVTPLTPSVTAIDPTLVNPFIHRFNVAIEQRIDPNTTITAAYVGSRSWNLLYVPSVNGFGGVPQASRPDPRYTTQTLLTNGPNSRYDALQTFLKRRFSSGLDFTAAWTYSHARDQFTSETGFGPFPALINAGASSATGFQGGGGQFTPRALDAEYGYSGFDVRHALTFSHVWELPFGRGRRWLNNGYRLATALAGGWSLSGVAVITTGEPVNVRLGRDSNDDGDVAQDRPALLQGSLDDLYARSSQEPTQWFKPQTEAGRLLGVPPDVTNPEASIARNALRAPGARFYDLSLMRAFALGERVRLRFEANAFNVFNNVNFGPPVSDLSSDRFGRLISTREGVNPRQLQLGLKVTF